MFSDLPPISTTYADKAEDKIMTHLWRLTKFSQKLTLKKIITTTNDNCLLIISTKTPSMRYISYFSRFLSNNPLSLTSTKISSTARKVRPKNMSKT